MSTELPTEEDVLAFLTLNAALGELNIMATSVEQDAIRGAITDWQAHERPTGLDAVALERLVAHDRNHIAAIADSERRLEVEQAEREVLRAVGEWSGRGYPPMFLLDAVDALRAARAAGVTP